MACPPPPAGDADLDVGCPADASQGAVRMPHINDKRPVHMSSNSRARWMSLPRRTTAGAAVRSLSAGCHGHNTQNAVKVDPGGMAMPAGHGKSDGHRAIHRGMGSR